jgi:predicted nucleic acid-binding protein
LRAADTSFIVPAFASWHEQHEAARRVLDVGVPFLRLTASRYREFVFDLVDRGVTGGAAYDALVAATAAATRADLITCDRRAAVVYDTYGVRFQLLG